MKSLTEKSASSFLKEQGFDINEFIFVNNKKDLESALEKVGYPCVMKVSSSKIVHKNKVGGVKLDIGNFKEALQTFNKLMNIKNAEGVLIQKQIPGKWYLLGIKKTPEFGHAIVFGAGGIYTEQIKDTSFRITPLTKKDCISMINETNIGNKLNKKEKKIVIDNLLKLSKLTKDFPDIQELDINPLMIYKNKGLIIDSRIVFT